MDTCLAVMQWCWCGLVMLSVITTTNWPADAVAFLPTMLLLCCLCVRLRLQPIAMGHKLTVC